MGRQQPRPINTQPSGHRDPGSAKSLESQPPCLPRELRVFVPACHMGTLLFRRGGERMLMRCIVPVTAFWKSWKTNVKTESDSWALISLVAVTIYSGKRQLAWSWLSEELKQHVCECAHECMCACVFFSVCVRVHPCTWRWVRFCHVITCFSFKKNCQLGCVRLGYFSLWVRLWISFNSSLGFLEGHSLRRINILWLYFFFFNWWHEMHTAGAWSAVS